MYFRALGHRFALNCNFVYLAISGTHLLLIRKQNLFVLFICNIEKFNITSIQINMKPVLYMTCTT